MKTGVWIARLLLGLTFILSGLSKAIDLWGFVYKIEEYIAVWELPWWRSLSFVCALGISGVEFVVGCMLLVGAFRKTAAWWAFAIMLFMLPLSLYIYISNPVNDCGCFGDFWVISNGATFAKNIVIMGVVIFLVSMAGEGAVLAAADGSIHSAPAPEGKLVNGVGAGDSMVAGFIAGWLEKQDYRHAFAMGVAAGSASAFSEQLATGEEVEAVYRRIAVS